MLLVPVLLGMVVQIGTGGNPRPAGPASAAATPKGAAFLPGGAVEDPPCPPPTLLPSESSKSSPD